MTRAMTAEPLSSPATAETSVAFVHPHRLRTRFALAFVIGLLAVLGVGVGALYAYDQQYQGRILPGVHVGQVDVSGLTADEATSRLSDAYQQYATGQVVVVAGDLRFTKTYAEIGRQADVTGLVAQAISVGRAGSPVERVIANARTAFRGIVIDPRVRFDRDALTRWTQNLAAAQHRSASDATIARTKTSFAVTESVTGRDADSSGVTDELIAGLEAIDAPAEVSVDLPFTDIEPALTTVEATAAVEAANRIAQDIVIRDGKDHWTISAASIRAWISFEAPGDGTYEPVVDTTKIDKALNKVAAAVARSPKNASFRVVGSKVVVSGPSANGRALNRKATATEVAALLSSRAIAATGGGVDAVMAVTAPSLSTAAAQAAAPKMRAISSWTTYFFITERNHFGANIWIPALDIDGTVVGPGETFDFWQAIGPISRAHGYGDGGAIINGKTEPQGALAGGICSNSTTLFNAVLRAGYQMGARRNHYYYIDRYPIGLDATVFKSSSGSTQTMSWKNDTKYPVLIRGFKIRANGKGYVKYVVYSVPTHRKIVIGAPTIRNVRPASDTVVYTSSLAPGARQRVEFPVDGKDVWRTVTVYENGKIIHQTTYYSHYSRVTGVTLIGRS
jgi:vancomycin resistance protein YoaR